MISRRQAIVLLGAAVVPLARAASPRPAVSLWTFERGLMGTRFEIRCYHPDEATARVASAEAFAAAEQINALASDYIADSELLELTRRPHDQPVATSPTLFNLISQAIELAKKTDGRFDPTLGPLTQLWRESRRRKTLPAADKLAAARAACGWKQLLLDPQARTITCLKPNMRLDLGGIAKGQAADAMLAVMLRHGIATTCITAGGDIRLGEAPPESDGWSIGVKTFETSRKPKTLQLANVAVSTSGDLHQFIELDGIRYSHIIDPATGLGLTREVAATVIAPCATVSDALATACCVSPAAEAEALALAAGATRVHLAN
jgi:thiamine biosynthesis lipoprotein